MEQHLEMSETETMIWMTVIWKREKGQVTHGLFVKGSRHTMLKLDSAEGTQGSQECSSNITARDAGRGREKSRSRSNLINPNRHASGANFDILSERDCG